MRTVHQGQTGPMMEQATHKIVEGTPTHIQQIHTINHLNKLYIRTYTCLIIIKHQKLNYEKS